MATNIIQNVADAIQQAQQNPEFKKSPHHPIKRLRIVKDTLRLWKDTVRDMLMEVCVGLHNFRLRLNPWPTYE